MQWLFTWVRLFTTKGCFILYTQLYKYMILPSRQCKCIQDYKTFSQIYTDDIMGEAVNYTNSVIGWEVQEHHQNAQCLLLWQIMGNFARLRSTFTQCGHGPLWWHRCFFYETWQKFTHITYRKKKFKVGKIVVRPCDRSTQLLFAKHRIIVALVLNGKIKLDFIKLFLTRFP